jgi:hypothetical protein
MQLGEFCRRLGVPYRQARYVLEREILPPGVDRNPDRGHHRQLTPAQAFHLGMVLKLKASKITAPIAGMIASVTAGTFSKVDVRKYDPHFAPFEGALRARLTWYVELGDLNFLRIIGEQDDPPKLVFPGAWMPMNVHKQPPKDFVPVVRIRVDLTRLAQMLRG